MRKVYFALLMVALPAQGSDWSTADTWRETTWQVINVIDWGQTHDIERCNDDNSRRCSETNPLLGANPSRGDIDRYFAAGALIHYGISFLLPPEYRRNWQYLTIGFGAATIYANYQVGVKLNF